MKEGSELLIRCQLKFVADHQDLFNLYSSAYADLSTAIASAADDALAVVGVFIKENTAWDQFKVG